MEGEGKRRKKKRGEIEKKLRAKVAGEARTRASSLVKTAL